MASSENGLVNEKERVPSLPVFKTVPRTRCDQFEEAQLSMMWNTILPASEPFYSLTEREGWLRLRLSSRTMEETGDVAFVGRRQEHRQFMARTRMEFVPEKEWEEAGICLVQNEKSHYTFLKSKMNSEEILRVCRVEKGEKTLETEVTIKKEKYLYLWVVCRVETYDFYYGFSDNMCIPLAMDLPANVLSSWENGFTGTYIGMYATANGKQSRNSADYDWFLYETI